FTHYLPSTEKERGMSEGTARPPLLQSVHTTTLAQLLQEQKLSFLVSTYQAGKVIVVRADGEQLNTHFRDFYTPMRLAARGGRLAIGTKLAMWEYHNQPEVARRLTPAEKHDACFLPRHAQFTGQIGIHDVAWAGGEIWGVNTRFSCLCTFHPHYSFVPR